MSSIGGVDATYRTSIKKVQGGTERERVKNMEWVKMLECRRRVLDTKKKTKSGKEAFHVFFPFLFLKRARTRKSVLIRIRMRPTFSGNGNVVF